jgi:hypothetical protein
MSYSEKLQAEAETKRHLENFEADWASIAEELVSFPDKVDAVLLVNNLIQDPASLLIKAYHAGYA